VAKPSSGFRARNRATKDFLEMYGRLPKDLRKFVYETAIEFDRDPTRSTWSHRQLRPNSKGNHIPDSFTVRVTMSYRAIYVLDGEVRVWYWIGTHAEYDRFTGA
jgi:hypothetical protein